MYLSCSLLSTFSGQHLFYSAIILEQGFTSSQEAVAMSPTKLPAESSKDVQGLAPPEEKGPSPVDEGEKGVLDKTPKEDMQYRVKGNSKSARSAQRPNRALQGKGEW
jgi:hypothetical protein